LPPCNSRRWPGFAARVLALACLATILWQESRQKPEYGSASTLSAAKSN
jgi:hypothetical protein